MAAQGGSSCCFPLFAKVHNANMIFVGGSHGGRGWNQAANTFGGPGGMAAQGYGTSGYDRGQGGPSANFGNGFGNY